MNEKATSLKNLILSAQGTSLFLFSKWKILFLAALFGAILGCLYKYINKPVYTAESTLSLELGSNNSMITGLSALGLGGSDQAGLFDELDNIIWLYSSDIMLKKTLLSNAGNQKECLINILIRENTSIRKKIDSDNELKNVRFKAAINDSLIYSLNTNENKIINFCIREIKKRYLSIDPEGKTVSIFRVRFASKNESFSKNFTEKLVENVNAYYLSLKTKKYQRDISLLQVKADSLKRSLNKSMYSTALGLDNVPYANPNRLMTRVNSQQSQVDAEVSSAAYNTIIQSLEASKLALAKELPLIQVIDKPTLPLQNNIKSWPKAIFAGVLISILLTTIFLIIRLYYKKVMSE